MANPTDLQALFANLRPTPGRAASQPSNMDGAQMSSGSASNHFNPQIHGSGESGTLEAQNNQNNQNTQLGHSREKDDRTSSLLNLLKFSQPNPNPVSAAANPQSARSSSFQGHENRPTEPQGAHARGISASDLVASFMGGPAPNTLSVPSPTMNTSADMRKESTQEDPQDILLRLLNRQKEASKVESKENKAPVHRATDTSADDPKQDITDTPAQNASPSPADLSQTQRVFGSERQPSSNDPASSQPGPIPSKSMFTYTNPFDQQAASSQSGPTPSKSMFTYVNPFDQLAASSPRNRTPKPETTSGRGSPVVDLLKKAADGSKRKSDESSPEPSARRISTPAGVKSRQSPAPMPFRPQTESVANALDEVAGQLDRQAGDALARAEAEEGFVRKEAAPQPGASREDIQRMAAAVRKELDKDENKGALEKIVPRDIAEGVRDALDEVINGGNGGAADNGWESADGEGSPDKDEESEGSPSKGEDSGPRIVKVYNFPIKPFVTITIKNLPDPELGVREDGVEEIARLKKPFDQTDRALTSATPQYIVYAQVKSGGVRVIRQDDAMDRALFRNSNDRVFNVSIANTPYKTSPSYAQAVIATGVSGTVYWAPIFRAKNDLFDTDNMEAHALIFPPSGGEDSSGTSGGQLKTRARRSSRHPDYFAIGRGRSIHIIFVGPAGASKYRKGAGMVDTEQLLKDRSLKITTGKAGKDFSFSEDDTTIVTLDKNGKIKFWDVRDLVEGPNPTAPKVQPIDINTPVMELSSALNSRDKPWPTSVMLLDKARPYARGIALRYMIVGLKQNHTLQLWDLALGKPVQELHFPHSSDADAICSFGYDPTTGILVVGHPTRNSIFLVHLSAPRYSLKPTCQADYIQRIVNKDPRLSAPESTAFLSGIREISFASKGQLRCVELLSADQPKAGESGAGTEANHDPSVLFELYVMHSRGVTCMRILKEDLGWSDDNKVIHGIDAQETAVIELADLRAFQEESISGAETPVPSKVTGNEKKSSEGGGPPPDPTSSSQTPPIAASGPENDTAALQSVTEKSEKKKKGRSKASKAVAAKSGEGSDSPSKQPPSTQPALTPTNTITPPPTADVSQQMNASSSLSRDAANNMDPTMPDFVPSIPTKSARPAPGDSITMGISSDFLDKEIKKIEKGVSIETTKVIRNELNQLQRRLDEDRQVSEAKEAARTETVLRLVSKSLNDNVEKSLNRIVQDTMQRQIGPAIQTTVKQVVETHVSKALERRVSEVLTQNVGLWMTREMQNQFPAALAQTLNKPDHLRAMSDAVSTKVTGHVHSESNKQASKIAELNVKVDQLTGLLRGSIETIHAMAAAQSDFQAEILKLQRQLGAASSRENTESPTLRSPQVKTAEEIELDGIRDSMTEGNYHEGALRWLRSERPSELFDEFFVQCSPAFLGSVNPLIALSAAVVISQTFETNTADRLTWLESIFKIVDFKNPEVGSVGVEIMDKLISRLEGFYMQVAEINPQNIILRRIPPLTRQARELKTIMRQH